MSVLPVAPAVCPWPVDPACFTEEWDELAADVQERSLALASATLVRLTGYRVGRCPITVRPCTKSCAQGYGRFYQYLGGDLDWVPHINMTGQWVNACGCVTDCSCGPLCEIRLPAPVGVVTSVLVGAVDITADTKVQGDRLIYTGTDPCPFPSCQNLAASPGEENTFAVTYQNSYPVDGMGAYAAAVLAMEFAKACTGASKCRLPSGTTRVTRQGVSYDIVAGSFPDGATGIREVDAYIALWRPKGSPRQPAKFWTPNMPGTRVERTW